MRYLKSILFLFVLLLFSIKTPWVSAQETNIFPVPPDTTPIIGQEHAYSVLFRGNGDAVISMRAAFANEGQTQTNTISFRIPRVEPRRASAFQVIREPDAFQWYGQTKYQKAEVQFSGDTLTITIPQAIKPNTSGSVLLVFSASGYTKKDIFGAYSYAFETFKVESASVTKATIGISVDSDLVLAGAKGQVNYRFSETDTLSMAAGMEKVAAPNSQLDQMYSQVGYGTITKNVSHLEPLESYTLRGRYAGSFWRLYAVRLIVGILVAGAIVVGLVLLIAALVRSLSKQQNRMFVFGMGAVGAMVVILLVNLLLLILVIVLLYRSGIFPPIIQPMYNIMKGTTDAVPSLQ